MRDLFKNAEEEWKRKREKSAMHVIIIDEIDALCRHRGGGGAGSGGGDSGGGGGAHRDAVVNQLLSKIDGLDQFDAGDSSGGGAGGANQNVLVIGTTNRKDMIDDAVLRPGRLEIHVRRSSPILLLLLSSGSFALLFLYPYCPYCLSVCLSACLPVCLPVPVCFAVSVDLALSVSF